MHRDCRIEVPIAHDVEDGREGFFLHQIGLGWHLSDRGHDVIGFRVLVFLWLATRDDAAIDARLSKRGLHGFVCMFVDQRTEEDAIVERRPDGHLGIGLLEPDEKFVANFLVDDDTTERRAALAGRADRAEEDSPYGKIEIGGRCHDHAVVAAEFEKGATQTRGDDRRHLFAHAATACRTDEWNSRVRGEFLAEIAAANDDFEQTIRYLAAPLCRFLDKPLAGHRGDGRFLRRFPDHRVATNHGEGRVPGPHRDRIIEGGDDGNGSQRDARFPSCGAPGVRRPW